MERKRKEGRDESYYVASQWRLMWRKFRHHKIAMASLVVLVILYLGSILSGFIAPQQLTSYDSRYTNCPPTRVRFIDAEGRFHLRPFVYGIAMERDLEQGRRRYTEDLSRRCPLRFFTEGLEYRLFGFIPARRHLFGVEEGGAIFLYGTDAMGRDLFSRLVLGSRISLSIGFAGFVVSLVLGVLIGGISGYFGGGIDAVIQRIIEVLLSFPTIPLWMGLSAAIPPSIPGVQVYLYISVILSFIGWTGLARVVRSRFISMREEDYVMAARVAGCGTMRIIVTHMVPGFLSYLIVNMTLAIPGMILAETALSFLGLGIRSPDTSWGVLLQEAQQILNVVLYPWRLIPLAYVVLTVLTFNFLGDGLRDAADPYR